MIEDDSNKQKCPYCGWDAGIDVETAEDFECENCAREVTSKYARMIANKKKSLANRLSELPEEQLRKVFDEFLEDEGLDDDEMIHNLINNLYVGEGTVEEEIEKINDFIDDIS